MQRVYRQNQTPRFEMAENQGRTVREIPMAKRLRRILGQRIEPASREEIYNEPGRTSSEGVVSG